MPAASDDVLIPAGNYISLPGRGRCFRRTRNFRRSACARDIVALYGPALNEACQDVASRLQAEAA